MHPGKLRHSVTMTNPTAAAVGMSNLDQKDKEKYHEKITVNA